MFNQLLARVVVTIPVATVLPIMINVPAAALAAGVVSLHFCLPHRTVERWGAGGVWDRSWTLPLLL